MQPAIIIVAIILASQTLQSEAALSVNLSFAFKTITPDQREPPKHELTTLLIPSGGPFSSSLHPASNSTSYNGNLTIAQGSSLRIVNANFTVNGYVFVYGNLSVINSTISTLIPPSNIALLHPSGLLLADHAAAVFINSTAKGYVIARNFSSLLIEQSSFTQNLYYENLNLGDFSHAAIVNSTIGWIWASDNSTLDIDNSTVGAATANSKVHIYRSTIYELSPGWGSVFNVYFSKITHILWISEGAAFLWNTTAPQILGSSQDNFSPYVFGSVSGDEVSGRPVVGIPSFSRPLLDIGAGIAINGTSFLGAEIRFYWGTTCYGQNECSNQFQIVGVDENSVYFLFWNGTGWQKLSNQGSVTSPENRDGYFWGIAKGQGIYALAGLRTTASLNYYLLLIPVAAISLMAYVLLRRSRSKPLPL